MNIYLDNCEAVCHCRSALRCAVLVLPRSWCWHRNALCIGQLILLMEWNRATVMQSDRGAGLLILLTIIVITTNLRLIVENILKYGVLTRPQAWVLALVPRSNPLLLLAWVAMAACILMAWIIENIGCNRLKAERKASLLVQPHGVHLYTTVFAASAAWASTGAGGFSHCQQSFASCLSTLCALPGLRLCITHVSWSS